MIYITCVSVKYDLYYIFAKDNKNRVK